METGYCYRYRCDVIIRGRPPHLGLCYSNVTGQLPQKVRKRLFITRVRLALCWQASAVASEASVLKLNLQNWVKVHHSTESCKTSSTHAQHAVAAGSEPSHTTLSQCPNVVMQDHNAAAAVRTWSQHAAADGPHWVRRQSRGRGGDAWHVRLDRRRACSNN